MTESWLPADFAHPLWLQVTDALHLRPIRADDVTIDLPAVLGSRDRLWTIYGPAWSWPPADLTREQDRADLARHEAEINNHESFNYALLNADETELLGCVYIDPAKPGADADLTWWVVDALVGTDGERALDEAVPEWITRQWPFHRPRYIGTDISWPDWIALPDGP